MKLKTVSVFLIGILLVFAPVSNARAEETGYPFDWKLYPLEYSDNRYYIKSVVDERPDEEKNTVSDIAIPSFSSLDLEVNLKEYLNQFLPVSGDKLPVILRIKSLKVDHWTANREENATIELKVEFNWQRDNNKDLTYETEIFSIKKQLSLTGIHEKQLSQVLVSCLRSLSDNFEGSKTHLISVEHSPNNQPEIPEPIHITPVTTENGNEEKLTTESSQSSQSSNPKSKKVKRKGLTIDTFTSLSIGAGLGFGNISDNFGEEFSLCYLPQTKQSLGFDIFYAFPLGKNIAVSFGTGIYGHIDIDWYEFFRFLFDDPDDNFYWDYEENDDQETYPVVGGNFCAIQFYNDSTFFGIGHHSLKGYFIEFGSKLGKK